MLDAFALIGYYLNEPRVNAAVSDLFVRSARDEVVISMCVVNIAETLYRVQRRRGVRAFEQTAESFLDLPLHPVAVDLELSIEAARLKAVTPISLAYCYAAALAMQLDATLVTADADFRRFAPGLAIEWLGPPQ